MPKAVGEEEIVATVRAVIAEMGSPTMKDMGAVMKNAKARFGAPRARGWQTVERDRQARVVREVSRRFLHQAECGSHITPPGSTRSRSISTSLPFFFFLDRPNPPAVAPGWDQRILGQRFFADRLEVAVRPRVSILHVAAFRTDCVLACDHGLVVRVGLRVGQMGELV